MASSNNKKFRKITRKKLTPKVIPPGAPLNDPLQFLTPGVAGTFNTITTDESGYGTLPAAERNNTYFAYFNDAADTEPEILSKSAIYIKYLIDKNGELTDPKPGDVALYNLKGTFEQGRKLFISPEQASQTYSPLLGSHSIENVGTVQLVLTSEYGTGASDMINGIRFSEYVNSKLAQATADFTSGRNAFSSSALLPSPDGNYNYWDMGYPDINWDDTVKYTSGSNAVSLYPGGPYLDVLGYRGVNQVFPSYATGSNLVSFDSQSGVYDIIGDPRDYNLNLYVEFFVTIGLHGPANTSFTFQLAVQRSIDNGSTWTNVSPQSSNWCKGYDCDLGYVSKISGVNTCVQYAGTTGNDGNKTFQMGYITTPQTSADPSYQYRLVYRIQGVSDTSQWRWFINYNPSFTSKFYIGQDYKANLTAARNQNNSQFWLTGSIPSETGNPSTELLWLTASNKPAGQFYNLSFFTNPFNDNSNSGGFVQVFVDGRQEQLDLGFTQPNVPAVPQKGDYIRFEYDKSKQTRILDIKPYSNTYAIGIWPNDAFGPSTVYDHFTISRVIDDGNYIILNKFYPASGSVVGELTGFARPENLTQEMQDNFGNLTTQLVKDGVLNQ